MLLQGGHFSGIYRKVQLKPLKWVKVSKGDTEEERPIEALMVLKYGGVLTHAGRKQVNTSKSLPSIFGYCHMIACLVIVTHISGAVPVQQ